MEKFESKEIKVKRILIIGILSLLMIALVAFLIYEVFFVDILGIFSKKVAEKEENQIDNTTYINNVQNEQELDNKYNQISSNIVIGESTNINEIQINHYYYNQLDNT